jgi:ribose transport system permease protein
MLDRARRNAPQLTAFLVVLALLVAGSIYTSGFASSTQLRTYAVQASFVGIVALGQTLCILTGGIDLSVPSVITASAVMVSILSDSDADKLPQVILLVVALAAAAGLINGLGVAYANVPPIIMTLGMGGVVQGLMLVYTKGGISAFPPPELVSFVGGKTLSTPHMLWIWVGVILIGVVLLAFTTFGRRIYATGTNRTAARIAGVNVSRLLVVPYVVSAVTAACTGILLMGYSGQAYLTMGDPYLFASAAAVAVGGASILGGSGNYIGTVAGALVLTILSALLVVLSLEAGWLLIAYGAVLLTAALLASLRMAER